MSLSDTIVAVASPVLPAPRGIVRLSGPLTFEALRSSCVEQPSAIMPGARRVRWKLPASDGGIHELPARVLMFAGPRSYTGQDAAEVQLVGNPFVVQRVLDALLAIPGIRAAQPGEFTARAFLSGKLTAEQAEGVGALIAARSSAEHDAADRLISGRAGDAYRVLADELAGALALVEAGIDFTDQDDVVAISPSDLLVRLRAIASGIASERGPIVTESTSREPIVALIGPPNAGKSTLFNALLHRSRAVVSDIPGTTRDVVAERCDLAHSGWSAGGFTPSVVTLIDLAGLDDALAERSQLDAMGQDAARRAIDDADVLVLCDPTGQFERRAVVAAAVSRKPARPLLRVRTKADLAHAPAPNNETLAVCALDGWNLGALARAIVDAAEHSSGRTESLVLPRHRRALSIAGDAVDRAIRLVEPDVSRSSLTSSEVVAAAMREALDHLGELAGHISPDDVIGRIFATFCIGK